jgi:hypothetical protein
MKLRYVYLFALFALPAWPNACTLSASYNLSTSGGHWTGTGCTGGSYIPGNGDTVTLADGVTLTQDQNWTIGASGASNTTAAISSTNTGQVIVNGGSTLTLRGDAMYANGSSTPFLTFNAGSHLVFDSSASSSPTTTRYRVGDPGGYGNSRAIVMNGTSASHVTVTSNVTGGALPGIFQPGGSIGSGNYGLGSINWSYADFSYIGDSGISGFFFAGEPGYTASISIQHVTCNVCGQTYLTINNSPSTTLLSYGSWTNTQGAASFNIGTLDGTATFQHLSLDLPLAGTGSPTYIDDYSANSSAQGITGSGNFLRYTAYYTPAGVNMTNDYLLQDRTSDNPHWTEWYGASTLSGNIFDSPDDVTSDSGELYTNSTNSGIVGALVNNILLPTKTGNGNSELGSAPTSSPGVLIYLYHNTWVGSTPVGAFGMQQTNEGGISTPITAMESNLGWSNGGSYCKVGTEAAGAGGSGEALNSVTLADYNYADANAIRTFGVACSSGVCASGTCPNSANSYFGNWSSATAQGPHDVDVLQPTVAHPYFADTSRNVATFDTAYLHKAAGAQWVTSTGYTVGQIVSDPKAGVYNGATVNYICTVAHTSGSTTEPNVGASWRSDWQFGSLTDIAQATGAGTLITDGAIGCAVGCTMIQALEGWVKRGFTPQNPALWCSGHDGEAVGAVPFCANGRLTLGMLGSIAGM